MADKRLANELVTEEDKDLIIQLFKNEPEYANFLLEKASRARDFIREYLSE